MTIKPKEIIQEKQFSWILGLLHKSKINYLVDSGTLLGLIRKGELIKWDKDIDITIFEKDIKKIDFILDEARKKGYLIGKENYKSIIVGFSLKPNNIYHNIFYPYIPKNKIKNNRVINFSVMRKNNGVFWEPILFSKGSDKKGFSHSFFKIIRGFFRIIERLFSKNKLIQNLLNKKQKRLYKKGTRTVPIKYFEKSTNYNGIRIPKNFKEYLKFRYGEWKKPSKNWSYMRDDKSMKKQSPEELGFI